MTQSVAEAIVKSDPTGEAEVYLEYTYNRMHPPTSAVVVPNLNHFMMCLCHAARLASDATEFDALTQATKGVRRDSLGMDIILY